MKRQAPNRGTRVTDPSLKTMEPRAMIWDEETKKVFLSMASEVAANAAKNVMQAIGVDPVVHREQHLMFVELIPWIKAQKHKAEAQADFWRSLITENMRRWLNASVTLLVISSALGLSGAWKVIAALLTAP